MPRHYAKILKCQGYENERISNSTVSMASSQFSLSQRKPLEGFLSKKKNLLKYHLKTEALSSIAHAANVTPKMSGDLCGDANSNGKGQAGL